MVLQDLIYSSKNQVILKALFRILHNDIPIWKIESNDLEKYKKFIFIVTAFCDEDNDCSEKEPICRNDKICVGK